MYFYRSPLHKRPAFYVDNRVFVTDGKTYCADDIISIEINCILGRLFPARKDLNYIEELIDKPPLFRLYGSVHIKTLYGEIRIPRVYRIMEAYLHFKRILPDTQAYYTYGLKKLRYEYKSIFEKSYFENRHYFSSLYVLNEKDRLESSEIMEKSRQWAEECGYRLCKHGEPSTFKQYVLTNNDDRWITIFADSLEGCYAAGAVSQCRINSTQYGGLPTLYFEVYDKRLILIAYGEGEDVSLYFCGDENLLKEIGCTREMLCGDYSIPEKAAVSNGKTFKEILENTDIDECLKDLAEKFGINDYFIRDGYYGFDSMDRFELREFANGYHMEAERIRPDEYDKTAEKPFENIYQGNPAFDILRADEKLVSGREFSVTCVNVGMCGTGFSFCIESEELHNLIADGMKKGKVPISMRACKYTTGGKTVEFECEYQLFRGRYAFLFEAFDAELPDGVVIHPANIKTDEDKARADEALEAASVTVSFVFESEVRLEEDLNIVLIPMRNFNSGVGVYRTKLIKEVQK